MRTGGTTGARNMNGETKMKITSPTYPFRLRDPVNGRLVRARFIAKLKDVADCYAAWEIVAPAESKPQH
jgi:hypothetical protein